MHTCKTCQTAQSWNPLTDNTCDKCWEIKNPNVGKCGHARCAGGSGELCYEKGRGMRSYDEIKKELEAKARLEYLRGEILAQRISYSEVVELAELAKAGYIEPNDATLLEWAGVPERN